MMNTLRVARFQVLVLLWYCSCWNICRSFSFSPYPIRQRWSMRLEISTTSTIAPDTTTEAIPTVGSALSLSLEEMAEHLQGYGRARLVWDCYRQGIDPALLFADDSPYDLLGLEQCLPGSRRYQRLGRDALQRLALLHDFGSNSTAQRVDGGLATLTEQHTARDGTTKLLLTLRDQVQIETVIIPFYDQNRSTLCISSQVGCRQACTFCATGTMGRVRSLTTDEILVQMFFGQKVCNPRIYPEMNLPPITNVVFMGMGEPSDNAAAVIVATRQLTSAFLLSRQKVTVSTVAPTPEAFAAFALAPCVLAWSVHAASDARRRQLVPTTRYRMTELRQGLIEALLMRPFHFRTTMLEVALMEEVNDTLQDAEDMAVFVRGLVEQVPGCKCMVNLIPYNEIQTSNQEISKLAYRTPRRERVLAYQKFLWSHGIHTHVRVTRGDAEQAACGQLVTSRRRQKHNDIV